MYSGVPSTFTISGGVEPYRVFSSNSAVLPVTANLSGNVFTAVPAPVAADTTVIITAQDSAGATVTSTVTVRPNTLINAAGITITPNTIACGANVICAGQTGTVRVQLTGPAGSPLAGRQVRFDVVSGSFSLQTSNPAQPTALTVTAVTDSNGFATAGILATLNVPSQNAVIRVTDVTTGASATAQFFISQASPGTGAATLSIVPDEATITTAYNDSCSSGVRVRYYIFGGTPPYRVVASFPDTVQIVNPTVTSLGGFFEAVTNGSCVDPLTFVITDAAGLTTQATLINKPGTATRPAPTPAPALIVSPATVAGGACAGKTFTFAVVGGTAPYNPFATSVGVVTPAQVTQAGGRFMVSGLPAGPGTYTFSVSDSSTPGQVQNVSVSCT